jgi:hypothetical protein
LRQIGTAKGWIVLFQPNFLSTVNNESESVPWTFQPLLQPFLPVRKALRNAGSTAEISIAIKDRKHWSLVLKSLELELLKKNLMLTRQRLRL